MFKRIRNFFGKTDKRLWQFAIPVCSVEFIGLLILVICTSAGCYDSNEAMQAGAKPVVKEAASKSGISNLSGRYFEFDGHEYVQFTGWGDSSRYFSVTHSPKCSCLVQEEK